MKSNQDISVILHYFTGQFAGMFYYTCYILFKLYISYLTTELWTPLKCLGSNFSFGWLVLCLSLTFLLTLLDTNILVEFKYIWNIQSLLICIQQRGETETIPQYGLREKPWNTVDGSSHHRQSLSYCGEINSPIQPYTAAWTVRGNPL